MLNECNIKLFKLVISYWKQGLPCVKERHSYNLTLHNGYRKHKMKGLLTYNIDTRILKARSETVETEDEVVHRVCFGGEN